MKTFRLVALIARLLGGFSVCVLLSACGSRDDMKPVQVASPSARDEDRTKSAKPGEKAAKPPKGKPSVRADAPGAGAAKAGRAESATAAADSAGTGAQVVVGSPDTPASEAASAAQAAEPAAEPAADKGPDMTTGPVVFPGAPVLAETFAVSAGTLREAIAKAAPDSAGKLPPDLLSLMKDEAGRIVTSVENSEELSRETRAALKETCEKVEIQMAEAAKADTPEKASEALAQTGMLLAEIQKQLSAGK